MEYPFLIILYIILIITHLIEAKHESKNSDVTHWDSILTQYIIGTWFAWVFPIPLYFGVMVTSSVRAFFDWMYNHYEHKPLSYLGELSKSDENLKKANLPFWFITTGRFIISLGLLAIMILILAK